jgi:hypothetical protein
LSTLSPITNFIDDCTYVFPYIAKSSPNDFYSVQNGLELNQTFDIKNFEIAFSSDMGLTKVIPFS